jgi:hypothetical protein
MSAERLPPPGRGKPSFASSRDGAGGISVVLVAPTLRDGEAFFHLHQNDKVWIVVDRDAGNPLFVFADPPKRPVPKGATYFGAGIHDIGARMKTVDG